MRKVPLKLRTLGTAEWRLYRCARSWQAAGHPMQLRSRAPLPGYAAFDATYEDRDYSGWVRFAPLLKMRYPELNDLAWHALDERYVVELLNEPGMLAPLPAPPQGWAHVRATGIVERAQPEEQLISFESVDGMSTLFRTFPEVLPQGLERVGSLANELPAVMDFVLGSSVVSLSVLDSVELGDALLIGSRRLCAMVGATTLCSFDIEDDYIMLNEQIDNVAPYDEDDCEYGEEASALSGTQNGLHADPPCFSVDSLPVRLEFVLQRETMSVAEVAKLHAGAVLPVREGAEGRVSIRANGQVIAFGELIQVGDCLAVEVRSLRIAQLGRGRC
ncbi:Surface presentation of antigens protein SpaO [Pandoraea horticolens]|uniref:Surface presentation of antigens protein SpaO n=1 Tax=Pandoraea horticolens TaxID=2508298 RepID=A0A5E4XKU2_9BURK|nr:type III secretion system cytoplasmic ring protein SctQ [Pandoraea horticolens]VVE36914.1 Surface presentation of antigens protein SpaO [Pandoraea horticolens]